MRKVISFFYLAAFIRISFFYSIDARSQSLSTDSDNNIGIQDSAVARAAWQDVHFPTGKIVYVWCDKDASASTRDLYCAIYNKDMTVAVSRFRINYYTTGEQIYGYVKVNQNDSSFVVTWSSNHNGDYDVYTKKISLNITNANSSSVASAVDVLVNDHTAGNQYVPVPTFNYFTNELLIGYRDYGTVYPPTNVESYFVRFDYSGSSLTKIGSDIQVNGYSPGHQHIMDMAVSPVTGELITVNQSQTSTSGSSYEIVRRVFIYNSLTNNYDGQTEATINSTTAGNKAAPRININSLTGSYVVVFSDDLNDGSGFGVYSNIFNSTHTKTVSDFGVPSYTLNNQLLPKVVWDEVNNYLVYFFHYSVGNFSTVRYRLFHYNGSSSVTAVAAEAGALIFNGVEKNTYNYYGASFFPSYNPISHKIYLGYDVYKISNNYNGGPSNGHSRVFLYNETFPTVVDGAYYAELKDELDGSFHATLNHDTLYFKYQEKYNVGSSGAPLNYKIYDYKRQALPTPVLTKHYGMNYFKLCMRGIVSLEGTDVNYFILETINDKGEVRKLRFKYVPEY